MGLAFGRSFFLASLGVVRTFLLTYSCLSAFFLSAWNCCLFPSLFISLVMCLCCLAFKKSYLLDYVLISLFVLLLSFLRYVANSFWLSLSLRWIAVLLSVFLFVAR